MNTRIIVPFILAGSLAIIGLGCKCSAPAPLTEPQKAVIRQEVIQAMKPIWAACEQMAPDVMTKYCQDGPDFAFVITDGKAYTFAEFSKLWAEMIPQFPAQKINLRTEKVIVLAPDAALYFWQGGNDMIQKDGTVLRADPYCGTYLFRKTGHQWKAAYFHESSLPMVAVKPAETVPGKK